MKIAGGAWNFFHIVFGISLTAYKRNQFKKRNAGSPTECNRYTFETRWTVAFRSLVLANEASYRTLINVFRFSRAIQRKCNQLDARNTLRWQVQATGRSPTPWFQRNTSVAPWGFLYCNFLTQFFFRQLRTPPRLCDRSFKLLEQFP